MAPPPDDHDCGCKKSAEAQAAELALLKEKLEAIEKRLLGKTSERLKSSKLPPPLPPRSEPATALQKRKDNAALRDARLEIETVQLVVPKAECSCPKCGATELRRVGKGKSSTVFDYDDEWPRVDIEILPPEVQREGLHAFEVVGADSREVVERRAASTVVVRLVYKKLVHKDRARNGPTDVLRAEAVELPIPRGIAGPGLLADTIVRRWQDHQPLNRLEAIYAREGLPLAKSTICTWHDELADLARPLVRAMFADALSAPYLCVDATGVLVQAPERCRNGHFWVVVAPEKHVLYGYSKRHDSAATDELLRGFKGYLVADAHSVYDHLYTTGDVIEVGCWAHCRRYFFKALASEPERAKAALSHIGALFALERAIADSPRKKKEEVRRAKSRPIVDHFFDWCDAHADTVLDESPLSDGIRYARNQRVALRRFLDDGRLPLHNNISELNLRRQVVGRRNWLFVGSDEGAQINTIFVSLLASCRLHDIEPLSYMRDLLCLLPSWPPHRLLELAPATWQKTLQEPETQEKLLGNVFRRVLLSSPS